MGLDPDDPRLDPHPDADLDRYRYFDGSANFTVELRQPSTVADALLHVMEKARIARREFKAKSAKAYEMEVGSIQELGKYIDPKKASREEWVETEIAKCCADLARPSSRAKKRPRLSVAGDSLSRGSVRESPAKGRSDQMPKSKPKPSKSARKPRPRPKPADQGDN
jgi:hypothetical protein